MNTCGALGGVIGALAILAPAAEVAANVSEAAGIGAQTEPSVYFTALTSVFPAPSVSPALQSIRRINPRGKKPNKTQQKERLDWRQPIQTARSMPAATSRARSSPRLTHACTSAAKLNRRTAEPVFGGTNEAAIVSTAVALDGGQAGPHLLVGSSRSGQLSFSTTTSGPGVSGIGVLISCAPRVPATPAKTTDRRYHNVFMCQKEQAPHSNPLAVCLENEFFLVNDAGIPPVLSHTVNVPVPTLNILTQPEKSPK